MSSKDAGFKLWVPRLDGNNPGGKTDVEQTGVEKTQRGEDLERQDRGRKYQCRKDRVGKDRRGGKDRWKKTREESTGHGLMNNRQSYADIFLQWLSRGKLFRPNCDHTRVSTVGNRMMNGNPNVDFIELKSMIATLASICR